MIQMRCDEIRWDEMRWETRLEIQKQKLRWNVTDIRFNVKLGIYKNCK